MEIKTVKKEVYLLQYDSGNMAATRIIKYDLYGRQEATLKDVSAYIV